MPRKGYIPRGQRCPGRGYHMEASALKNLLIFACKSDYSPKSLENRFSIKHGSAVRYCQWLKELNLTSEDLDKLTPTEISNLYYNRKERSQFNEQGQKIDIIRPNIPQLYQSIQEEKRSVRNSIRNKLQLPESEIIKRDYINHPKNLELTADGSAKTLSISRTQALLRKYEKEHVAPPYRQVHIYGNEVQMDFTGVTLPYGNPNNPSKAQFLVMVLPASGYTFVLAIASQQQADVMPGIAEGFKFYGGVPDSLRCDNFKGAVSEPGQYGGVITADMEALCSFPARSLHPKDKGAVEAAVKVSNRYILAYLNKYIQNGGWFNNLNEINTFIKPYLDEVNSRTIRGRTKSRKEEFEIESKFLHQPSSWDYQYIKAINFKVPPQCRFVYEKHEYVLPVKWKGVDISVEIAPTTITFASGSNVIAIYQRKDGITGVSAHIGFLPEEYESIAIYDIPSQEVMLKEWAEVIGKHTKEWVNRMLNKRVVYKDKIRLIVSVLRLPKGYIARYKQLESCIEKLLANFGSRDLPAQKIIDTYQDLKLSSDVRQDHKYNEAIYMEEGRKVLEGKISLMVWPNKRLFNTEETKTLQQEFLNGAEHYAKRYAKEREILDSKQLNN